MSEHKIIQFTVANEKDLREPEKRLARRSLVTAGDLPCRVGAKEVVIPGAEGDYFELRRGTKGIELHPLPGRELLVNGKRVEEPVLLFAGDRINVCGYELSYFIRHETRSISRLSRAMSLAAKLAVGLFFLIELWIMLGLPSYVAKSSIWDSALSKQRISRKLDTLRKRVSMVETQVPLTKSLLAKLSEDLNDRARYLRQYEDNMRGRQRREMLVSLDRIELLLDKLESNPEFGKTDKPDMDSVVMRIIGTKK